MGKPLNYNSFAKTYSETRFCVPWLVEILVDEFIKLESPAEIIEVGCGTGNYSIELSKTLPVNIYRGFDLSEEMLKIAKSRTDKIEFKQANADEKFPYNKDSADAVFLIDVIHHIVNYENLFKECRRILKPGGIIIIATDTKEDFRKRSGIKFFPETLKIERERYPTIKELNIHSENSGFLFLGSETSGREREIDNEMISRIERKFSSSLRLISDEAFKRGIQRVKNAKQNGEKWVSSYTILKYKLNK